ncbi:hypothetical protein LIER_05510 [Lithospermum erythrorhizon]|uniref:Cytochrome P450 n=1 Tax=Lithospermum erythrorhizon TaxID=34254 RepID=A0AAV3P4U8_LITER
MERKQGSNPEERRICAGSRMGILMVEYILGTLIYSFDWKLQTNVGKINMDETFGLALQKKIPVSAIVIPRLPPCVYAP